MRHVVSRTARPRSSLTLRAIPNREELPFRLNACGLLGHAVEIGGTHGEFSEQILEHWRGARLISVDPWVEFSRDGTSTYAMSPRAACRRTMSSPCERAGTVAGRSEIWRQAGSDAA